MCAAIFLIGKLTVHLRVTYKKKKKMKNEMTYCLREPMETPFDVGKFTSCKFLIRLNSGNEIMEVV
jgi:hypothetical protein